MKGTCSWLKLCTASRNTVCRTSTSWNDMHVCKFLVGSDSDFVCVCVFVSAWEMEHITNFHHPKIETKSEAASAAALKCQHMKQKLEVQLSEETKGDLSRLTWGFLNSTLSPTPLKQLLNWLLRQQESLSWVCTVYCYQISQSYVQLESMFMLINSADQIPRFSHDYD